MVFSFFFSLRSRINWEFWFLECQLYITNKPLHLKYSCLGENYTACINSLINVSKLRYSV